MMPAAQLSKRSRIALRKILRIAQRTFPEKRRRHPLRAWRQENSLNQTEVAVRLGVSTAFVSMVESGLREPSLELAIRFSQVTGIDADQFCRWREADVA